MYIRFVIEKTDPNSGRRQGLFQAALTLRDSQLLSKRDDDRLESIWGWFNKNLERPSRLSLSARPNSKAQAISWFKDSAADHISKMRSFSEILERYDIAVQMLKTQRPGYIVYEDDFQIAAYPFADTPT